MPIWSKWLIRILLTAAALAVLASIIIFAVNMSGRLS